MLELLLVSDYFYGHRLTSFMNDALQGLSKGTFAQKVNDLKPVREVVTKNCLLYTSDAADE